MSELAPGWAETTLESLVTFSIGGAWGSSPDSAEPDTTTVAVMRGADYRNWATNRAASAAIRRVPTRAAESRRLEAGNLVIEVSGGGPTQPVGRVVLIDDAALQSTDLPLTLSNFCRRAVVSRDMTPRFVYYQLLYKYLCGDTERFQTATTNIRNLNFKKYLAGTMLAVAPYAEQGRIVAAIEEQFSRLDAGVAALTRVGDNLKRMRSAVLESAYTGHLVRHTTVDARHVVAQIVADRRTIWERHSRKPYKEPAAADSFPLSVPDHWRIASLESVTDPVRVICYGILMPKQHIDGGVPYVRVKDMKGWTIDVAGLKRTSQEIASQYARASLRAGDLLLAIRGSYGRVAIIPPELEGANITQDSARIASHPALDHRYLLYYLGGSAANRYYQRVARGVAVKGVNIGDLRRMPVPVPPPEEQLAIADEVERHFSLLDEVETAVATQIRHSSSLRSTVLAAAFSGELVHQDPNDESASVLLERVAAERPYDNKPDRAPSQRRRKVTA